MPGAPIAGPIAAPIGPMAGIGAGGGTLTPGNSVSLTGQVAKWSGIYETTLFLLAQAQSDLDNATATNEKGKNSQNITVLREYIARLQMRLGLAKEFMEFWKERIKDFIQLLKSFGELASGGR